MGARDGKIMDDFIFGSMDTEALRVEHHRRCHQGIAHLSRRSPRDPLPGQAVSLTVSVGAGLGATAAWIYFTNDGSDPAGEHGVPANGCAVKMRWSSAAWDDITWGYTHAWSGAIPGQADQAIVRYRIGVQAADGTEIFADDSAYYAYCVDSFTAPDWSHDAIIYHILVDRFARGNGKAWNQVESIDEIYGGDLAGILDRLDYIQQLGANTLYLSPIFLCPNHHRYNALDYYTIDPVVGSRADFRRLLDTLHARGMHLILDFVPNHWSDQHATFQSAIADPHSPYRSWYNFTRYPDEYECFFHVKSMPRINLRNPGARACMCDAAAYWLNFGVDGLRLDYTIGPTPDFWADFRLATRRANADCWVFGEVVDSPHAQMAFSGLLDGCLDFILLEAFRQTFATHTWDGGKFASFLRGHFAAFPPDFSRPAFLDNHDMDRFLWAAQGDIAALKLAALCQFTLPGAPMIYYGTEVGLSQERATRDRRGGFGRLEEARLPMPWDSGQNEDLLGYYRQLSALRGREGALRRGAWALESATTDVFAYRRTFATDQLLVVINLSPEERNFSIPPEFDRLIFSSPAGDCDVPFSNDRLQLLPYTGVVLRSGKRG